MNTMKDLREEVAARLRESLHGREIDMIKGGKPRTPHMLGITPVGEQHDATDEKDTLLDPSHEFWQDYEENLITKGQVTKKVETAIRSLREDDIFRLTYPYGEEADIVYIEVDKINKDSDSMKTSCKDCGTSLYANKSLVQKGGHYLLQFSMDCPKCDFSACYQQNLVRQ